MAEVHGVLVVNLPEPSVAIVHFLVESNGRLVRVRFLYVTQPAAAQEWTDYQQRSV